MAGYTTDNYGITKIGDKASKFSKGDGVSPGSTSNNAEAAGVGGLPGGKKIANGNSSGRYLPDSPNAAADANKQITDAAAGLNNIDPRLLDILIAGTGAAGVLGGHALYQSMRNKPSAAASVMDQPGTSLVPSSPKVTKLKDEQVIPREQPKAKPKKIDGPRGAQVESGGQARTGTTKKPDRYLDNKPTNPRNLPVSKQGSTDAAYSAKAAQDAAKAKAVAGANPGREAKAARLRGFAEAFRRVTK